MLIQQSALRYSHSSLNASAQNEDGACFASTRQQRSLSEPSQSESFIMKPTYSSIFSKGLAKINANIVVETSETEKL